MREQLLRLVGELRQAGIRISVAEGLDAMRAAAAAGLERRARMREALAAALVKDEADRPVFDNVFERFFAAWGDAPRTARRRSTNHSREAGTSPSEDAVGAASRPLSTRRERPAAGRAENPEERKEPDASERQRDSADRDSETARAPKKDGESGLAEAGEAPRLAHLRAIERKPFAAYGDLDYELAREALVMLARRFRVRMGRRLGAARRGRVDFRRTFRAGIQRGGALIEMRFRRRRPRRVKLVVLADVSGSMRYASELALELLAGARDRLGEAATFVFIDRLAAADFEGGHVVMEPALDLYARSDFGRVMDELLKNQPELLGPATLLVIIGDGRNNRRPPRLELLRAIAARCRAVYWLCPEPVDRWGTGDSALELYAREVSRLVAAPDLRALEVELARVA